MFLEYYHTTNIIAVSLVAEATVGTYVAATTEFFSFGKKKRSFSGWCCCVVITTRVLIIYVKLFVSHCRTSSESFSSYSGNAPSPAPYTAGRLDS